MKVFMNLKRKLKVVSSFVEFYILQQILWVSGCELLNQNRTTSRSFFCNWDSLHARLNSDYKPWSYKKKKHKKIKAYRKSF